MVERSSTGSAGSAPEHAGGGLTPTTVPELRTFFMADVRGYSMFRRTIRGACGLAFAFLVLSVLPAHATAGKFDKTFGGTGVVVAPPIASGDEFGGSPLIRPDGKVIVVGGMTDNNSGDNSEVLYRFLDNGTPDPAFGGGTGAVVVPMGSTSVALEGALLSDGRIVVAGWGVGNAPNLDVLVAVLTPDGNLDTTWGTNGVTTIHISRYFDSATAVAIDPSDRVIVVGQTFIHRKTGTGPAFFVARLDPTGQPDTSFSQDGWRTIGFNGAASDVAIQPNGKIVVVGGEFAKFAVARLLSDGTLDPRFSTNGRTTTRYPDRGTAYAVALEPDGRIVVAGGGHDFDVARYGARGRLDRTFSHDGITQLEFGRPGKALEVSIDGGGRIVATGFSQDLGDFPYVAIARFRAYGPPDPTFSGNGKERALYEHSLGGAVLDASGRLVISGGEGFVFAARFLMV
jgi:uncharacterized delta-60 repeat protein